ncbi:DUF4857 domain-containing protein [Campylobacter mucosalis]|uniref:DUF4857 domain-containing protein n=1 Tax=Campylobacter mucosalis TaxID=202 RepID=UPI001470435E|nr:DUF4857 domain-containing protein [Campylobacter mucosalis]
MRALHLVVLVFASLIFSYFLPLFINLALPQTRVSEKIKYSPVINEFLYSKSDKESKTTEFKILNGENISEERFFELLPFSYYSMLISRNKFPEIFSEYGKNPSLIRKNSQNLSLRFGSNKAKFIPLYPIMNTKEKFDRMELLPFLFKFSKNSIDVIDLETNSIDLNKTKIINDELKNLGFSYPAKKYFTNPSALKAFDEGAFIVDNNDTIFHIKQVNASFIINNTKISKPNIINIVVSEDPRREFYALLVSQNELGLIDYGYKFIPLDIQGYEPFSSNLSLNISPVDKILAFNSQDSIKTNVMDLNYTSIKQNSFELAKFQSKRWFKEYVLPFELKLTQPLHFYKFEFINFSYFGVLFSIILAFLYFVYNLAIKKQKMFLNSGIIAIFGIYGLIATIFYKEEK